MRWSTRGLGALAAVTLAVSASACDAEDEPVTAPAVTATPTPEAVDDAPATTAPAPTTQDAAPMTEEPSPEPTTTAPEPTTAEETTTPAAEPTTQAAPPGLPRGVEEYADTWVRAWGLGDDATMATHADRYVHAQFSGTAGGGTWARQQSGSYEEGLLYVSYEDSQTLEGLLVLVDPGLVDIGAQHAILEVTRLDPGTGAFGLSGPAAAPAPQPAGLTTDVGGYADAWVRAWGAGDYAAADVYGDVGAMYHFDVDPAGGTDWARTGVSGAEVSYQDGGGNVLVLYLDTTLVAAGATDGVLAAYYE